MGQNEMRINIIGWAQLQRTEFGFIIRTAYNMIKSNYRIQNNLRKKSEWNKVETSALMNNIRINCVGNFVYITMNVVVANRPKHGLKHCPPTDFRRTERIQFHSSCFLLISTKTLLPCTVYSAQRTYTKYLNTTSPIKIHFRANSEHILVISNHCNNVWKPLF